MDYVQVLAAKEAGATVEVLAEKTVVPIETGERLKISVPRFDSYSGKPIDPEIITYRKADLLRELDQIAAQRKSLDSRELAINSLLKEFGM